MIVAKLITTLALALVISLLLFMVALILQELNSRYAARLKVMSGIIGVVSVIAIIVLMIVSLWMI